MCLFLGFFFVCSKVKRVMLLPESEWVQQQTQENETPCTWRAMTMPTRMLSPILLCSMKMQFRTTMTSQHASGAGLYP